MWARKWSQWVRKVLREGSFPARAVKNNVFLVTTVGEVRAHVINQVAVVRRTQFRKKSSFSSTLKRLFSKRRNESLLVFCTSRSISSTLNLGAGSLSPKLAMSAKVLLPTPPLEFANTTERGLVIGG